MLGLARRRARAATGAGPSDERQQPAAGKGQRGFTLIELLAVLGILGVLSSVVVTAVNGITDKGESAALAADGRALRVAEEIYCSRQGAFGTEKQLVGAGLLQEESTLHDVKLSAGGPCGTSAASGFALEEETGGGGGGGNGGGGNGGGGGNTTTTSPTGTTTTVATTTTTTPTSTTTSTTTAPPTTTPPTTATTTPPTTCVTNKAGKCK